MTRGLIIAAACCVSGVALAGYLHRVSRRKRELPPASLPGGGTRTPTSVSPPPQEERSSPKDVAKITNYIGWKVAVAWEAIGPDDMTVLQHLAGVCELFIVHHAACEAEAAAARDAVIRTIGADGTTGLPRHRILCHQTSVGKQALIRQVAPTLYVDTECDVLKYLHRHIAHLVQADPKVHPKGRSPCMRLDSNVAMAASLTEYFQFATQ